MEEINFTPEYTTPEQQQQLEVFPIDATKCKNIKEVGMLLNALGMAMTKSYAEEQGLEHLLDLPELNLPKLK